MRVFFRPSADAYVLIYNIDTEGTSISSTRMVPTIPSGSRRPYVPGAVPQRSL